MEAEEYKKILRKVGVKQNQIDEVLNKYNGQLCWYMHKHKKVEVSHLFALNLILAKKHHESKATTNQYMDLMQKIENIVNKLGIPKINEEK